MLLIGTFFVNVAVSNPYLSAALAHERPCPTQSRPAGTMADESSGNVPGLSRKVPTCSSCVTQEVDVVWDFRSIKEVVIPG